MSRPIPGQLSFDDEFLAGFTRCPECLGIGGSHGLVHVRHNTGGGGVNRPCSYSLPNEAEGTSG